MVYFIKVIIKHIKNKNQKNMNMRDKSINEKVQWLLNVNKEHADLFKNARMDRQLYRVNHPTEFCALKCMDGRINISLATNTPLGIIRPYRNIGGYFDLGWPYLGEELQKWVEYGISKGRKSLILITYHYSAGDKHRGCAGFNHDLESAIAFTLKFHQQCRRFFGENNKVVFPIVVGLETDTDALIFHSQDPSSENKLVLSGSMNTDPKFLLNLIDDLYLDMDMTVKNDLLPLIQGNIAHIKEIKISNREIIDMKHREWVLAVGRGFDWLHEPNTALIVGPYSPDLSVPITKALSIISDNMNSGRILSDGFLVLTSAPFKQTGIDENRAIEKANFLRTYVRKIIEEKFPELLGKVKFLAVTVDENTRRLKQISDEMN